MKKYAVDEFRAAARRGERPEGIIQRGDTSFAPEPQINSRKIRFVASDSTIDHSKDRINQKGWDLTVFRSNPVVPYAHNTAEPPIGRAPDTAVIGDRLVTTIEFATADMNPAADVIYRLVRGGFIRGVSVGFLPLEWKFSEDKSRPLGIDFLRQKLIEISVVPIPCNPNSLIEARAKGIDTRLITNPQSKLSGEAARQARMIEAREIAARIRTQC